MQLKQALAQGIELLEKARIPSPRMTAEVLLMHAVSCDRAHLFAHPERGLTDCERVHYGRYLNERLQGKPTQYITGHQEFWGVDFLVNSAVLIPRPETELVVEAALDLARHRLPEGAVLDIADVGTGSGCIAVALARELPQARIYALDLSPTAVETARLNAERNGVEERIRFLVSDLLDVRFGQDNADGPLPPGPRHAPSRPAGRAGGMFHRGSDTTLPPLQMVVSNPPYVGESDRANVQREVQEFEPHDAVFAGESGKEVYARLIPQAALAMRTGGYLVLELGYDSEGAVREILSRSEWEDVRWLPDLAGITRVVTARLGNREQERL